MHVKLMIKRLISPKKQVNYLKKSQETIIKYLKKHFKTMLLRIGHSLVMTKVLITQKIVKR